MQSYKFSQYNFFLLEGIIPRVQIKRLDDLLEQYQMHFVLKGVYDPSMEYLPLINLT